MPRLSRQTPQYRKHKASGQAFVELSGHRHYLGPYGTQGSRLEYDRLLSEWLQNGRQALQVAAAEITLVELASRYLQHAETYYQKDGKPTREVANIRIVLRNLCELYGRTHAVDFGPLALKAHRERLVSLELSRVYVNKQVEHIKRMFKWAVSEELIPVTVHQSLTAVTGLRKNRTKAKDTAPVEPVSNEVVNQALPFLSEVVADMVRVQRLIGCRPGELCSMRPCDIDRNGEVWIYRPNNHKTDYQGRDRYIVIGPRAQKILQKYLLRAADKFCFSPAESEHKRNRERHAARTTPLSCGNKPQQSRLKSRIRPPGQRYTTDSYGRAIHYACRRAGIENWSPNRLRHAFATEVRKQYGLEAAQLLLGHAKADVTQVYAERDLSKGIEIARKIG